MAIKYKTSKQLQAGLAELRSNALEWANEQVKAKDNKGINSALAAFSTASSELLREMEIDILRENQRADRKGYTLNFLQDPEEKPDNIKA